MTSIDPEHLSSRLSHDLGAPIRAIRGFAQLLKRGVGAGKWSEVTEFAGIIDLESKRLEAMLVDTVAFLRLDSQALSPQGMEEVVELEDLASDVWKQLLDRAETPAQLKASRFQAELLPRVRGPAKVWRQLFHWVLDNSIKFHDVSRPLAVVVRAAIDPSSASDCWRIEFRDNGVGLPPGLTDEARARAFQLFCRLHDPLLFPGNGTGLALCSRVVEAWGGRVFFAEQETQQNGSTMIIELPRKMLR